MLIKLILILQYKFTIKWIVYNMILIEYAKKTLILLIA